MNPTLINQYRGLNPHLQGELLAHEGWKGFHGAHIVAMAEYLNKQVLPMGYAAVPETSLQIYQEDDEEGWRKTGQRYPDVALQSVDPSLHGGSRMAQAETATKPTWKQALSDEEDVELRAIALQTVAKDKSGERQLLAWIELLSPANKPGGSHYAQYMERRKGHALASGCTLVEIDYLHQQAPIMPWLPHYGET